MPEPGMLFQIQSPAVLNAYKSGNYRIEIDRGAPANMAAIYFSSHAIYYPNEISAFSKSVLHEDRYEFGRNRVVSARKHIFVRDIFKQWYLEGINSEINDTARLLHFLESETCGMDVVTLGSSAGGYAAVLFGAMLNASRVLTFSGQFNLHHILDSSDPQRDPLVFRHREESGFRKYYDLSHFVNGAAVPIFYFVADECEEDLPHIRDASAMKNVRIFRFANNLHGLPFFKGNLSSIINMNTEELMLLHQKCGNAAIGKWGFSTKVEGLRATIGLAVSAIVKRLGLYQRAFGIPPSA